MASGLITLFIPPVAILQKLIKNNISSIIMMDNRSTSKLIIKLIIKLNLDTATKLPLICHNHGLHWHSGVIGIRIAVR